MQGGQADLAFGIVLQEDGDDLVVALLKGNGERSKAILKEEKHFYIHSSSRQAQATGVPAVITATTLCLMINIGKGHYKSCMWTL